MPLTIEQPSAEDAAAGIAAHFEYRDDDHAATVRGTAKRGDRGLTFSRLEIAADNEDVTMGLLRSICFGELLGKVRAAAPPPVEVVQPPDQGAPRCDCQCRQRKGGRPAITDEHLRRVAIAYLKETGPGSSPGALARMAQAFERPEQTIRTWIGRSRAAGWLGPGVKGRAGCEPGARLRAEEVREDAR